jgi:hypothetical protein
MNTLIQQPRTQHRWVSKNSSTEVRDYYVHGDTGEILGEVFVELNDVICGCVLKYGMRDSKRFIDRDAAKKFVTDRIVYIEGQHHYYR